MVSRKQKSEESWGEGIEKSQLIALCPAKRVSPQVLQSQRVALRNRLVCPSVRYPTHSQPFQAIVTHVLIWVKLQVN